MKLSDYLPLIYKEKWESFDQEFSLQEEAATCSQCVMAPKTYAANLKCCTFYPYIPNYAVGALLSQGASEGAKRVRKLIHENNYIIPIGLVAPKHYQWRHQNKKAHEFGQRKDLLCPFYQEGPENCTVWSSRGSECATFFCKSSYGEKGEAFWDHIRSRLYEIELEISQNILVEKGYSPQEIEEQIQYIRWPLGGESEPPNEALSPVQWKSLWQHHVEKEENYFLACYELFLQEPSLSLQIPENLQNLS